MSQHVRAIYDFDAQPGSGEMSIKTDEILVVLRDVSYLKSSAFEFGFRMWKEDGLRAKMSEDLLASSLNLMLNLISPPRYELFLLRGKS